MDFNQNEKFSEVKIVYKPVYRDTAMVRFQKFVEKKYKVHLFDYWDLHKWSTDNISEFWSSVWEFFDIKCSQPYRQACIIGPTLHEVQWFPGARLNYTENILKYRDSHVAIIATDDYDNTKYVTYEDLYNEIRVYVTALKDCGVKKGDIICGYMSNKIEAVIACLAGFVIGAVWCGIHPILGAKAVISRLQQVNPKVLITCGNFKFAGDEINMNAKIPEIVECLPCLKKVIYVPQYNECIENIAKLSRYNCTPMSTFLGSYRKELQGDTQELEFEQVPLDHPSSICFTSGTTGAPKGLVHHNGVILTGLKDYGLREDLSRDDVILSASSVGWVTWNMVVSALHLGTTICLYDGNLFKGTRLYDVVDKFKVSTLFIGSSTVENMEKEGCLPTTGHSLKSLKQIYPIGSVTKPHSIEFLLEKVNPGMFCTSAYGSTETYGQISGSDFNQPVYYGELQAVSLGVDLKILNHKGEPVLGDRGDVVLAKPYPGSVMRIINDPDKRMLKEIYFSKYPGYWYTGDEGCINPVTKGLILYGRSDDTLNPKGARLSCSEYQFALEGYPGIMDSMCVPRYNSTLDEKIVLFLKMLPGHFLTPKIVKDIKRTIEDILSIEHVPDVVVETPDFPYSINGKKMNSLVKNLINHRRVLNSDVVANPSSIEFYKNIHLGVF